LTGPKSPTLKSPEARRPPTTYPIEYAWTRDKDSIILTCSRKTCGNSKKEAHAKNQLFATIKLDEIKNEVGKGYFRSHVTPLPHPSQGINKSGLSTSTSKHLPLK
jgi:hypothetical protein